MIHYFLITEKDLVAGISWVFPAKEKRTCACLNNTSVKKKKKWTNSTQLSHVIAKQIWYAHAHSDHMTLPLYTAQCAPLSPPAAWAVVSASFSRDTHWLTLDPPRAHTCRCSQGQKPCDCQPHCNSSDLRSHSKTKSRSWSELRSPEGSGLANVLQWCFLVGKKKKPQACLSVLTAWRLVSSKTKEEVGDLGGSRLFHELALEITWHHFYYTLFNRGEF